jgi:hypothetical protein
MKGLFFYGCLSIYLLIQMAIPILAALGIVFIAYANKFETILGVRVLSAEGVLLCLCVIVAIGLLREQLKKYIMKTAHALPDEPAQGHAKYTH